MPLVLDCETTGLDPLVDRVVEVATVTVQDGEIVHSWSSLVNPGIPIPPVARAIHHISDADVKDAPTLTGAFLQRSVIEPKPDGEIFVAHNAKFDSPFLSMPIPVCTWRCAKHVWPDAPAYGNQVLRYWLDLDEEVTRCLWRGGANPHRALFDAVVTAHILLRLLRERPIEELQRLSSVPVLLREVTFGMHSGIPWAAVPKGYLRWILSQDFDEDTMHTARHYA